MESDAWLRRLRLGVALLCVAALLGACGGGSGSEGNPQADFEAGLWTGPQLGVVTTTSVMLRWDTLLPVPCAVRYGPAANAEQFELPTPAGTAHELTVPGLTPATRYEYRLVIDGVASDVGHHFVTAPDDEEAPVRIVVLGDVGCGCDAELAAATLILQLAPDLVLFTGDLAYPEASEANFRSRFLIPFAKVMDHIPVYAAIGNHDADANDAAAVFSALALPRNSVDGSEQYYTHAYGCLSFTAINSEWGLESPAAAQVMWLDSTLAADTHAWKVVFAHRPAYSSGRHPDDPNIGANVRPLLEAHGVDFLLSGHDHNYQRTYPVVNGVPDTTERNNLTDPVGPSYIVTGGGGAGLYDVTPDSLVAAYAVAHHVTVLDFAPGSLQGKAVSPDGVTEYDNFTVTKGP
jgi:3',5'-cyclic AMP phosphodiesterase CpdA